MPSFTFHILSRSSISFFYFLSFCVPLMLKIPDFFYLSVNIHLVFISLFSCLHLEIPQLTEFGPSLVFEPQSSYSAQMFFCALCQPFSCLCVCVCLDTGSHKRGVSSGEFGFFNSAISLSSYTEIGLSPFQVLSRLNRSVTSLLYCRLQSLEREGIHTKKFLKVD